MKRKTRGIKDIAQLLNISVSTVSKAMRDTYDVHPETRRRVLEVAKEIGYKPNAHASALASGRTKNIAVIIPFITNYYYSTVISGMQESAFENGYNILLCVTGDCVEREKLLFSTFNVSNVDGLLVSIASDSQSADHFHELIHQHVPLVFFDKVPSGIDASKVIQDDFSGAYLATQHLIQQGYKRIAYLGGESHLSLTKNRYNGYVKALADLLGVAPDPSLVIYGGFTQQSGEEAMRRLISQPLPKPDAIFAVNDRKAVGAIQALNQSGIRVGKEIGVVGFTNDPISTIISPTLTTVEEPAFLIGKKACELLIRQINNPRLRAGELVLEGRLIERESTRR